MTALMRFLPFNLSLRAALPAVLGAAFAGSVAGAQVAATGDLFTWSGRLSPGATLGVKNFNGPIEIREGTGDLVEFRAEKRVRRSSEVSFEVEKDANGVT